MKHFIPCQWVSQGSLFHPFWSPNTRAISGGWFWEAGNALFLPATVFGEIIALEAGTETDHDPARIY